MKTLAQIFFSALILFSFSACEKKSCKNVVCASYQTCNAGDCLCPNGYEGDTCSVLSSTKYLCSWTVSENCEGSLSGLPTYYSVNISLNPQYAFNDLAITALFGVGTFYAEIMNENGTTAGTYIYFPAQSFNGIQVTPSSGTYYAPSVNGGTAEILLTLNYIYQGNSYSCIETFHKQ